MITAKQGVLSMAGVLIMLVLTAPSQATPFTFRFELPAWSANENPTLFGTVASTFITVDNGSTSLIGQSYQNGDILEVQVVTDGTYTNTWVASDLLLALPDLNVVYVLTDATGVPMLDLTTPLDPDTSVVRFANADGRLQLGAFNDGGTGYTPFAINTQPDLSGDGASAFPRSAIEGSVVQMVPTPGTLTLLGLGLAVLGVGSRPRKPD